MRSRSLALPSRARLAAAALTLGVVSAHAQLPPRNTAPAPAAQPAPTPTPLDEAAAAKLLAQLEDVSKTMEEKKYGYNSGIIRDLRDAGSSADKAFNLWLDCTKVIEFDEAGRTATEFSDWKRNQTKSTSNERESVLQMQVQWLTIVVMDANARTESARAEVVAAAVNYIDSVLAHLKKTDGKSNLGGDVVNSVFGRRYKLDITVGRKEGGATHNPGDIGGIYETLVFPYYRRNKMASSLMQAWTRRISQESEAAATAGFREATERFTAERLPQLKWGQMREMFSLGQQEGAGASMLAHIKTNMAHRDAPQWITELRTILAGQDPEAAKPAAQGTKPAGLTDPTETADPTDPTAAPAATPKPGTKQGSPPDDPFGGTSEIPAAPPAPNPAPEKTTPPATGPVRQLPPGTRPGIPFNPRKP
ncbi:MAG: hypothetical protein DVB22_000964 [Verrucomicrobia bacterium]|nr:MAG: hypothetical protein DVB22_000964 [Verrucomicrobiota bacterium]